MGKLHYCVLSESSGARYSEEEGILAEDRKTGVDFDSNDMQLRPKVANHLDRSCKKPSPFISVYADRDAACLEVERSLEREDHELCFFIVDFSKSCERVEYRSVRKLAARDRLDIWIDNCAYEFTKHEYLVLGCIPKVAIVKIF